MNNLQWGDKLITKAERKCIYVKTWKDGIIQVLWENGSMSPLNPIDIKEVLK